MHELALMEEILSLATDAVRREGATKIHRLSLRIGRLAGVEPEALSLAFEVACAGTCAEGATLEVESVAVVCHCSSCDRDFTPDDFVFACPDCGELSGEVRRGREIELESLEVS